jgi:hypothetical protein
MQPRIAGSDEIVPCCRHFQLAGYCNRRVRIGLWNELMHERHFKIAQTCRAMGVRRCDRGTGTGSMATSYLCGSPVSKSRGNARSRPFCEVLKFEDRLRFYPVPRGLSPRASSRSPAQATADWRAIQWGTGTCSWDASEVIRGNPQVIRSRRGRLGSRVGRYRE